MRPAEPPPSTRTGGFRNRDGTPITVLAWSELWEDLGYRIVHDTTIGDVRICTVWEGVPDRPLYYTGRRQGEDGWRDVDTAETATEAAAAHQRAVDREPPTEGVKP